MESSSLGSEVRTAGGKRNTFRHVVYEYKTSEGATRSVDERVHVAWDAVPGDPIQVEWIPGREEATVRLVGNGSKLPFALFWTMLAALIVVAVELRWEVVAKHRRRRRRRAAVPDDQGDDD